MAAGYLLGRFKKLRLALIVGSALASDDVRSQGATLLAKGPVGLAQPAVRKAGKGIAAQLVDAGKSAAVGAAGARIGGLSERLSARTDALQGNSMKDEAEEEPDDDLVDESDEPEDESYDEAEEDEDLEEEDDDLDDEYDEEDPEDEDEDEDDVDSVPQQRSPRRRRATAPTGR
jgi:hypothetical protein